MLKYSVACISLLMLVPVAAAQTHVDGYTRRDGTYVAPHYRSGPNNSYNDNWSVSPNVNPNNGQQGTRQPTFDNRPPQPSPFQGNSFGRPTYR